MDQVATHVDTSITETARRSLEHHWSTTGAHAPAQSPATHMRWLAGRLAAPCCCSSCPHADLQPHACHLPCPSSLLITLSIHGMLTRQQSQTLAQNLGTYENNSPESTSRKVERENAGAQPPLGSHPKARFALLQCVRPRPTPSLPVRPESRRSMVAASKRPIGVLPPNSRDGLHLVAGHARTHPRDSVDWRTRRAYSEHGKADSGGVLPMAHWQRPGDRHMRPGSYLRVLSDRGTTLAGDAGMASR